MGWPLIKLFSLLLLSLLTWQTAFAGLEERRSEITSAHLPATSFENEQIAEKNTDSLTSAPTDIQPRAVQSRTEQAVDADGVDGPLATSAQVIGTDSVDYWLDKMTDSMSQQNFQGTLIILQDNRLRAVKVKQGITDDGRWQTLESLSGVNQKIIRSDNKVTTIFPTKQLVTISNSTVKRPLHTALPKNYRELKKYYTMEMSGKDRIANKATQIVRMVPRDEYRYGYTFWLDRQSGLLLRCDLLDENRQVLEQLMYSNIELLPGAPQNTIDQGVLESYRQINLLDEGDVVSNLWRAKQLPAGFSLTQSVQIATDNTDTKSYHLVFSDGMASVSVFIEAYGEMKKPVMGLSSMGAVNAFSFYANGAYITAIGEVPASTVRMIAQSIEPVQ